MYFVIAVGAFSPSTVRGLIHTYTHGFITNSYSRICYTPVNLTALYIMVFMRASPLRGGLSPGTRDICGPLEIARAFRRVPFGGPQIYWTCLHENHYSQGCKIYRCIGNFMSMNPGRFQGPYMVEGDGGWRT